MGKLLLFLYARVVLDTERTGKCFCCCTACHSRPLKAGPDRIYSDSFVRSAKCANKFYGWSGCMPGFIRTCRRCQIRPVGVVARVAGQACSYTRLLLCTSGLAPRAACANKFAPKGARQNIASTAKHRTST